MNKREEEKRIIFASLKEALMILLDDNDFNKISVSQLVKKAGIARSTFYNYFTDKEDLIRFLIQEELSDFDQQFKPKTIEERYENKYINEVWQYLLKDEKAIRSLAEAGLSGIYLEEMNKHLLELFPYRLTSQEMINLYGLAGAQYNIIFNLFLAKRSK